ncbi:MAG: preprotein translocase subunit YajC [Chitinophagales bacterium]
MIEFLMAPSGGESSGGSAWTSIAFFGLFFLVLYFFMIRPQTKKAKDQKIFVNEIKAGDKIVTISGVHGKVLKVDDDTYLIEIDANTKIRIEKSAISMEYTKAMLSRKQNVA